MIQLKKKSIRYIYSGVIDLLCNDPGTNIKILVAASELCLKDLCDYIEDYLLQDKETLKQNFVQVQQIVHQFDHFTRLKQFYEETYQQDSSLIFKSSDFATINHDILLELIIKDNHTLKIIEIWDKLIEWSIAQSKDLPSDTATWTADNISTFGNIQ